MDSNIQPGILLVILLSPWASILGASSESPRYMILAPSTFHVGIEEKVSVTVSGVTHPVQVHLFLRDYPNKRTNVSHNEGYFKSGEPGFLRMKVEPQDVPPHDIEFQQYLYLVAVCNDSQMVFYKEVKIPLSYKDKIVLVQTDKPIYTPLQTVNVRVIPLDFTLKPSKDNVTVVVKNPQGIIAQNWRNLSSETGFITKALSLGEHSLIGNWTIVTTYGYMNSQNTTIKFEVKEYVLPKFSVRIIGPSHILPMTKTIHIALIAKYTFGKPVKGDAILRLAVTGKGLMEVKFFAKSTQLTHGKATFKVDTKFFKENILLTRFPEGRRLRIEADIVEKATGVRESAIDASTFFVSTPYHLSYEKTAMYFKPSLPYTIKIDVKYPNKNPSPNIPIQVTAIGTNKQGAKVEVMGNNRKRKFLQDRTTAEGQAEFNIDVPRNVISIKIQVETKDQRVLQNENAAISFTAKAYNSDSGSYLHIRHRKRKAVVGTTSMWDVFQNRNITSLSFMVISRGRILAQATSRPEHGINVVSTMSFVVTMEMSPRCRVLAYYITRDNEVVADSAVLEIQQRFPNKVRFGRSQKRSRHELPGDNYEIKVETMPWSRVGLLGVDESVYLLRNKYKLTTKKVFKEIKSLDGGCGVGPGQDNREVFIKSGMMIISNAKISTKENSGCLASSSSRRRKRAVRTQEEKTCCENGKFFSRASCTIRARFMVQATVACREAFLNCCRIAWNEKAPVIDVRQRQFFSRNAPTGYGDEDGHSSQQLRKYFPETWIFLEETAQGNGELKVPVTLPDTITTWILQAVSISNTTGFGMTEPSRITTFKDFFVSLTLPYSVQRGEQLSVIATVFNYGVMEGQFEVHLEGSHGFCSEAMPGIQSKPIKFTVSGSDARSVTFPIVPVQLGKIQMRVSATKTIPDMLDSSTTDTVERELLVIPEGVERRLVQSLVLDPQGVLRDEKPTIVHNSSTPAPTLKSLRIVQGGHQIDTVMLSVPSKAIPGSLKALMYLTGNLIGPVVTNLIKGGLGDILRMPLGCGEQNMIYLAPNVYVLEYLTNTKQVTADVESRAYRFIQKGYQQELGFRRKDKSFSAFGETRPGSTWLTAFVIKVFCAAKRFDGIAIDENLVCGSVSWLLSNQRQDGAFPEVHDLVHKSMLGGVHGNVAMTAFVLTALLECECPTNNSKSAIMKAVQYLEQELPSLHKANILALTTYSLALAKSPLGAKANQKLMLMSIFDKKNNTRHWDVSGSALNVETAGYALLAQLHLGRLKHGGPIVKWLTEQRNAQGGFVSTQDTCVALQGLAKYSEKTAGANLDLSVAILPETDANWKRTIHVNNKNALMLRSVDITPFLGGELFIDSLGTGVGQMQIELVYNVPTSKNETCLFDVKVDIKEAFDDNRIDDNMFVLGRSARREKRSLRSRKGRRRRKCKRRKRCRKRKEKKDRNEKKNKQNRNEKKGKKKKKKQEKKQKTQGHAPDSLFLKICTRYRKPGKSGMTIMDIGIFTGFEADEKSLVELKKNVRPTVDRFEISARSIVLYVSEIESAKEFCAAFKVNRVFGVGTVQPVPIKVYDYYEPGDSCTTFYAPNPKSELRLGICKGEQCKCTQDGCTPCTIDFNNVDDLMTKACKHHEFVIRGTVLFVDEESKKDASWLTYFIEIKQIFKQRGSKLVVGGVVTYNKRAICTCPELHESKDYLIMGQEEGAQLTLNKNTIVIPWEGKTQNEVHVLRTFRARMNEGYTCPQ